MSKPNAIEYYSKLIPDRSVFDNLEYRIHKNQPPVIAFDYYLYDALNTIDEINNSQIITSQTILYRGFYKVICSNDLTKLEISTLFGENSITEKIHFENWFRSGYIVNYYAVTNFDKVSVNLNDNLKAKIKYVMGVPI